MIDAPHSSRFKSKKNPVLFLAPGSGLGHLVRTGGLCLGLARRSIPSLIMTTSALGQGFSSLTGLSVIHVPASRWKQDIPRLVKGIDPLLMVQDTFFLGLRGEDLKTLGRGRPWILLCRRLRFARYMDMLSSKGVLHPPNYVKALITEPLSLDHQHWVKNHTQSLVELKQRLCFPLNQITPPDIPEFLDKALSENDVHLIVHSGPSHEIQRLVDYAEEAIQKKGTGIMAVINPHMAAKGHGMCFDYFPAAALYPRAAHIYTGGGYNAIAETAAYQSKHTAIAFERHYDDQAWRISQTSGSSVSDNLNGCDEIAACYDNEVSG